MNREETIQRLEEAQKLPHATLEDLQNIPKGISTEKLSEYLQDFVKPTGTCWLCEKELYIYWGLQHGIAHCTNCHMEVKVFHYLEDDNGKQVRTERSLQYHPKNFSVQEENE